MTPSRNLYRADCSFHSPAKLSGYYLDIKGLPFKLATPKTNYDSDQDFISSLYILGGPTDTGTIGCWARNEEEYTNETKDLLAHGVTNPNLSRLGSSVL